MQDLGQSRYTVAKLVKKNEKNRQITSRLTVVLNTQRLSSHMFNKYFYLLGIRLVIARCVLDHTPPPPSPVTQLLQSKSGDIVAGLHLIQSLKNLFVAMRNVIIIYTFPCLGNRPRANALGSQHLNNSKKKKSQSDFNMFRHSVRSLASSYQFFLSIFAMRNGLEEIDQYHDRWYKKVIELANKVDVIESKPRTCGRQVHRGNAPATSISEYYKRNITIPLIDHFNTELKNRFGAAITAAYSGLSIYLQLLFHH